MMIPTRTSSLQHQHTTTASREQRADAMQGRILLGVYDKEEMDPDMHLLTQKATPWHEPQTQERVGSPSDDRREAV